MTRQQRQQIDEDIKGQILAIVNETIGYIRADEICNRLLQPVDPGRTQETIRRCIRELVNAEDNLIGSSVKGYFKINSREKAEESISYLVSRIPDLQTRADNITQIWNQNNLNNQI